MKPCNPGQLRGLAKSFSYLLGESQFRSKPGCPGPPWITCSGPSHGSTSENWARELRTTGQFSDKLPHLSKAFSRTTHLRRFQKSFRSGTKAILDNTCMTQRTLGVPITCAAVPKIGGRRLMRLAGALRGPSRDGCRQGVAGGRSN